MTPNWPLKGDKRQKDWAEKLEFWENFWSFGELLEYFGGILERDGDVEIGRWICMGCTGLNAVVYTVIL